MATNEVPRGPISDHVVENVKRLRAARNMSLADLSAQMATVGRPMLASGLHRLEQGKRRIDVDDLVALAAALDVSPITLLMPFISRGDVSLTSTLTAEALVAWDWMRAARPLDLPPDAEDARIRAVAFQGAAVPSGARMIDPELTRFYQKFEPRDPGQKLWTAREEGEDDGEHQEAP